MHGLLQATHLAFAHHFPLVISPDDVWGCIAQGFSRRVAASAGALDERLARIEILTLRECETLEDIRPIAGIRSLRNLTIKGCPMLPAWAQGSFEGDALRALLARLRSQSQ